MTQHKGENESPLGSGSRKTKAIAATVIHLSTSSKSNGNETFSWFILSLMASVTFLGILSELVP